MSRSRAVVLAAAALAGSSFLGQLAGVTGARALEVGAAVLVTDDATAHPGAVTDPTLVDPWGVSSSATSPFWVSAQGTGKATVYAVDPVTGVPSKVALEVVIPGNGSVTGQAFSPGGAGGAFGGDLYLFTSEDGTVSGWRAALGSNAENLVLSDPTRVYKGAALGSIGADDYLYLTNFHAGTIDVLKGSASAPDLLGSFTDPTLPAGYAPFGIESLGGSLFVSYALQNTTGTDDVPGAGHGIVDVFDLQGVLQRRLVTGGVLDSPWGLALAPSDFGALAGRLLVGNAGDGLVHVYDPVTGSLLDVLTSGGQPLVIDGLRALVVGNGGSGGSAGSLYFTAGPDGGTHGIFGTLSPVPEPDPSTLAGLGLLALLATRRRG